MTKKTIRRAKISYIVLVFLWLLTFIILIALLPTVATKIIGGIVAVVMCVLASLAVKVFDWGVEHFGKNWL